MPILLKGRWFRALVLACLTAVLLVLGLHWAVERAKQAQRKSQALVDAGKTGEIRLFLPQDLHYDRIPKGVVAVEPAPPGQLPDTGLRQLSERRSWYMGDDYQRLDLWERYMLGLKETDGIPDRELEILRRDIRLMGLPDPARTPYGLSDSSR